MILVIIGSALAAIGILTILAVFVVASPRIASIPARRSRTATREAAVKERILVDRLTRRFRAWGDGMIRRTRSASTGLSNRLQRGYRRLRLLAQEHRVPVGEQPTETCAMFLASASDAMAREAYDDAEEQYLACLKIDAKHRNAYVGLAELYRKRKEVALAEETLQFLRRLCPEDAEIMVELARVLRERGKDDAALKQVRAALEIAPKNPRYLDFAVELAIVKRQVASARKYVEQLRETNPENQKLAEFEERIGALAAP